MRLNAKADRNVWDEIDLFGSTELKKGKGGGGSFESEKDAVINGERIELQARVKAQKRGRKKAAHNQGSIARNCKSGTGNKETTTRVSVGRRRGGERRTKGRRTKVQLKDSRAGHQEEATSPAIPPKGAGPNALQTQTWKKAQRKGNLKRSKITPHQTAKEPSQKVQNDSLQRTKMKAEGKALPPR